MLEATPSQPTAGVPIDLRLMLHDASGEMIEKFEPTHEKLAHLIIVRDGLDEFAHLHPKVDARGGMTQTHTFPTPGTYHVFLDYKAAGQSPATARTRLVVDGAAPEAPKLVSDVPGTIQGDVIQARVSMRGAKSGAQIVTFEVEELDGSPITDLEPYLGAMGHLVVISADASQYVHAHPLEQRVASDGVEFEVHFSRPGLYKAWGQFQRDGMVLKIPVVMQVGPASGHH